MDKTRVEEAVVALIEAIGTTGLRVAVRTYVVGKTTHYRVSVGGETHRFERKNV